MAFAFENLLDILISGAYNLIKPESGTHIGTFRLIIGLQQNRAKCLRFKVAAGNPRLISTLDRVAVRRPKNDFSLGLNEKRDFG